MPLGAKYGGRKKGTPNKATLEKRAKAAAQLAANRNAPIEQRELAKDALMRIARVCEGAMAVCRPTTQAELERGVALNPDGSWARFAELGRLTAWCYKAAADFESPKMLGISVAPPPPPEVDEVEIIPLRVFEGGREIKVIAHHQNKGGKPDAA